jgi:hypothetical protein
MVSAFRLLRLLLGRQQLGFGSTVPSSSEPISALLKNAGTGKTLLRKGIVFMVVALCLGDVEPSHTI